MHQAREWVARYSVSFLLGAVLALSGAWAAAIQVRATDHATVESLASQVGQVITAQEQAEDEIHQLTVSEWQNQQSIAVLSQRVADMASKK